MIVNLNFLMGRSVCPSPGINRFQGELLTHLDAHGVVISMIQSFDNKLTFKCRFVVAIQTTFNLFQKDP